MSLINVFKGSLIITVIANVAKAFLNSYENSRLKKNVTAFNKCFKNSKTYSVLYRYANKKPFYKFSFVYKAVMAIAGVFDRFFAFINKVVTGVLSGSFTARKAVSAKNADVSKKLYAFGLLFMSIPIGSIVAMILLGSVSVLNMIICWVIFAFGFILVLIASCQPVLKNSFIFRAVKGFFDLIR